MSGGNGGESRKLSSEVIQGFKWSSASMALQAVLQLVAISALARLLSPREFGIVSIALIFTNFFERVGFLGAGPAVVQRKELTAGHIRSAHALSVFMGLLLSVLMFFTAPLVGAFFREIELVNVVRVLSIAFIIDGFGAISESLLQRELKFRTLMVTTNSAYLLGNGVIGVGLALLGFGVWSLVWAAIAMRFARSGSYLYLRPQVLSLSFARKEAKEVLEMGFGFSLGKLLSIFALMGDNFIVGRFLGAAALGMYGRAYQLMTIPATYFGQVLEKVMFPIMSKHQASGSDLRQMFFYSIECGALIGLPAGVFMFFLAPEIIHVLFGEKWLAVAPTLQILALGTFPRLCYKQSDTLLRSLGAVYRYASRQVVYSVLVICGAAVGCAFGLEAVAGAVSFAVTVNYLMLSQLGIKLLGVSWKSFAKAHLSGLWCSMFVGVGVGLLAEAGRGRGFSPLSILCGGVILSLLLGVLALRSSPRVVRPRIIGPLAKVIEFKRFGLPGRFAVWVLSPERA
jgi:PST family polysaccharide transporter